MRKSIIKNYFLVVLTQTLSAVFTAFKETKNLKGSIVRKNTTIKAILIAILTITSFATTLNAKDVNVFYFNGMNTSYEQAFRENKKINDEINYLVGGRLKLGRNNYKEVENISNFHSTLVYTSTGGRNLDSIGVFDQHLSDRLINTVKECKEKYNDQSKFTVYDMNKNHGVINLNPDGYFVNRCERSLRQYGGSPDYPIAKNIVMSPLSGKRYIGEKWKIKDNSLFISYSRGNVYANALQYDALNGRNIQRLNIASPAPWWYGSLITSKTDRIIGFYTWKTKNYFPDYYYYNLSYKERKSISGWLNDTSDMKKFNKRYFGRQYADGHSFLNAYMNKEYGLYNDILWSIVQKYHKLGGE